MKIVLGSESPRRRELLSSMGFEFRTIKPEIDEIFDDNIKIENVPEFLSFKKSEALIHKLDADEILICSDTVVILEEEIIGKPKDKTDAKQILRKLSGKTHFVITGVTIRNKEKHITFQDKTEVTFNKLSDSEIDSYLKTNDAMDKAGAYGIQDWIGLIGVQKINGSYTNVMGLPTSKLHLIINNFTQ
jgi:septum formation protein